ncbi:MAG: hypothetical protein LBT52_05865, partial [Clostridiales Family XIII bacterium]|nr:hypothetical protein [Clostridiales Family XIII bacterium]
DGDGSSSGSGSDRDGSSSGSGSDRDGSSSSSGSGYTGSSNTGNSADIVAADISFTADGFESPSTHEESGTPGASAVDSVNEIPAEEIPRAATQPAGISGSSSDSARNNIIYIYLFAITAAVIAIIAIARIRRGYKNSHRKNV